MLTEKLGGAISVQSVAGQGSTFAFFVRTTKCAQSPSPRLAQLDITQIQPIENENGAKRQMAILVTEDNIVNQKLLVKQLVRKDYVVYTAKWVIRTSVDYTLIFVVAMDKKRSISYRKAVLQKRTDQSSVRPKKVA